MIPQVDLFLFVFWEKLKTPKRHFEINLPLCHHEPHCTLSITKMRMYITVLCNKKWGFYLQFDAKIAFVYLKIQCNECLCWAGTNPAQVAFGRWNLFLD